MFTNSSSSTVATRQRFLISRGTRTNLGSFAPFLRTTSCRSGKWRKIFTMMKNPKHQRPSWRTPLNEEELSCFRPINPIRSIPHIFLAPDTSFIFLHILAFCLLMSLYSSTNKDTIYREVSLVCKLFSKIHRVMQGPHS